MIQKLWLYPPLAIARLGPSATPCASYLWGPNDLRPRGTGKTTILPAETLSVAADGTVTSTVPSEVVFKDAAGFRPVCPFFELHGEWTTDDGTASGPITEAVLTQAGLSLGDITWQVDVGNLKAFHYTLDPADRVAASVQLAGNATSRQPLRGISPAGVAEPLVPVGQQVPLGSVQLTRPSSQFPELRLRFTPAAGHVYGPTNLLMRSNEFPLPASRRILNPNAPWARFPLNPQDFRTNPVLLYGRDANDVSLGLVDDVCDGLVRCTLPGGVAAVARIVVGPPSYAPDRRPLVSLADGMADRVKRLEVQEPAYVEDLGATTVEIRDLMERVLETVELMNLDYQNLSLKAENGRMAAGTELPAELARAKLFEIPEPLADRPLPLTEDGRQHHRRFVSLEVFEDILRERPELLSLMVREPMTSERFFDRRMPALMRGADRRPLHLTRRQYDLLVAWVRRLRRDVEDGA